MATITVRFSISQQSSADVTTTIDEQRPATWFDRLVQPAAKRMSAANALAAAAYRKVQPFDSNVLIDLVTAHGNGRPTTEDLKFVSWRDFDLALEADTELFGKLAELAKGEADMLAADEHALEFEEFVPMNSGAGNSGMYYRVNRAGGGAELEKEYVN